MTRTPRISIVDDDFLVRNALCRVCRSVGYEADCYESAEEFLEADSEQQPACLILDLHLPGQSGLELQSQLRDTNVVLPIIFITAVEDEDVRNLALARGAIEFLHKPLDAERFLDAIANALKWND